MKITTHYITNVEVDSLADLKFCCHTLQSLVLNNPILFTFEIDRTLGVAKMYQLFGNPLNIPTLGRPPETLRKLPYNFCQFCGEKIE